MDNINTDILICGLVRDQEKLEGKLNQYVIWQKAELINEIIFSTWIGEIDRYKGLRKKLKKIGVVIIEIAEPILILKGGHQLHQMLAFHYGLQYVKNPENYILRTRTDLADSHSDMEAYFKEGIKACDDFLNKGLSKKILVENAQMIYPFLCGDAQFFGKKKDLVRLINMSNEMECVFNRLAVEQTFFFKPFKDIKIFRRHFFWNLPHSSEICNRREEQLSYLAASKDMMDVMKLWWKILDSYFTVGWSQQSNDNINFDSFSDATNFNDPKHKIIGIDKTDVITSSTFVKALVNLYKLDSCSPQQIQSSDVFNLEPAVFDVYEKFRKEFSDLPSPKASKLNDGKNYKIEGCAQHFFVKDTQDIASFRYHQQITHLRRENEILKKELDIRFSNSNLHKFISRILPRRVIVYIMYKFPFLVKLYSKYFMKTKIK
ncbi:hypothetical protein OAM25_02510 [Gammaproteobacteria bacterium]|nr:hypothetical protein [Gammaproteobacteria bacterium]